MPTTPGPSAAPLPLSGAGTSVEAGEPKRILFVDDDENLLESLRDALRPHRRRWEMKFVTSGEDALAAIDGANVDVVISDLRMPSMDGATLLEQVRLRAPTAVRIVLSGHAELRVVARAAGVAHQLLAKPCETDQLVGVIERACAIKGTIAKVELNRTAVGASVLPSVPHLYLELTEAMASGEATIEGVSRIIEQDMGMAAKILQLANSAYFGRRQPVSAINEAVVYLGLDAVQALVLQAETFNQLRLDAPIENFDLDRLQRHCWHVGSVARKLLSDRPVQKGAFAAGLLHDVGILVLAVQDRDALSRILLVAHEQQRPLYQVERELCQVTHAEIGAHMLALWGLPFSVTGAVAGHHDRPAGFALDENGATYIANVLVEEAEASRRPGALPASELDADYLAACGVTDQLPRWRELAAAQVERS